MPLAAATEDEAWRPFTSLIQVDAVLALARVLKEQERAYMMLRINGGLRQGQRLRELRGREL